MKKFSFPLARVMDWRNTQARLEESRLEVLHTELRSIDARETALRQQHDDAKTGLLKAASVTGADLAALDRFRRFTAAEHTRLKKLREDCGRRIAAQIQVVASKRRDVKLVERLKQKRLNSWTHEYNREVDAQADEAYLIQWKPAR